MRLSAHPRLSSIRVLAAGPIAAVLISGCATATLEVPEAREPPPPLTRPVTLPESQPRPIDTRPTYAGPWEDPTNPLYKRTIYFDYDRAEIRPEYIPVMQTHARYLGVTARQRVTLEGHTDERGTREYNLALGDQRAEAVRRYLLAEGVPPEQMSTLSYGEERPAETAHGETAWQRNRRVILQY